jgi:hypothetical protein
MTMNEAYVYWSQSAGWVTYGDVTNVTIGEFLIQTAPAAANFLKNSELSCGGYHKQMGMTSVRKV